MQPGLYLVGTPIGNLADMTARAVDTLRAAHYIFAEDTRHTRILLNAHQIQSAMGSCHQFNEASRTDDVLRRVCAGQVVALVTNAGMPCVSDPGARLVAACRAAGLFVTVIPGASAVTAAVALCGFTVGGFVFEGFLPRKPGARRKRLALLGKQALAAVFFESPFRCLRLLAELNELWPERALFLGRELTKLNEECLTGTVAEIYAGMARRHTGQAQRSARGEMVFVLAPAPKELLRAAQREELQAE